MSLKLEQLLNKKNLLNNQLMDYKKRIHTLENDKRKLEKELWHKCDHIWVKRSNWDTLCKSECSICGVYNNHYIYTARD
jgi:hypothetical protein